MSKRNIIAIGSSAGGVAALRRLIAELPQAFPGSLFLAQHLGREGTSMLQSILSAAGRLPVVVPEQRQPVVMGTVYVPLADHHLLIDGGHVELSRGPRQNRHRPSVDVLFRSAARAYGPRVVGVVLTGMLDDGTAGLLEIKRRGGVAVVQDPADAQCSDMPVSALRFVDVDHCVPLSALAPLLHSLAMQPVDASSPPVDDALESEFVADTTGVTDPRHRGRPSPFTCPECHGVLWTIDDGDLPRFRCRVGHGYSIASLIADQDTGVEAALWAAARSLDERADLAQRMAEQWRNRGMTLVVRDLDEKARESKAHAARIRELIGAVGNQD